MNAEVENNLVLGLAHDQAQLRGAGATPYLVTVAESGAVVGCAVRTPPFPLAITRFSRDDALALLAADVAERYPDLDDVGGPEPSARHFSDAWVRATRRAVRPGMSQRLYELRRVQAPDHPPPGRLRPGTQADAETLTRWVSAFIKDTGVGDKNDPADLVQARLQTGRIYVWDDDRPMSMVAWTGKTRNGVRVNLVYTPEENRWRGYASAAVAALSQRLLDAGNSYCCLYTDLANPTSNDIYQRIGYRAVCDVGHYLLS